MTYLVKNETATAYLGLQEMQRRSERLCLSKAKNVQKITFSISLCHGHRTTSFFFCLRCSDKRTTQQRYVDENKPTKLATFGIICNHARKVSMLNMEVNGMDGTTCHSYSTLLIESD